MRSWQIWMLVLTVCSYFVAVALWMGDERRQGASGAPAGSASNTSPEGTSLAFAYLQQRPGGASLLTRSVDPAEIPFQAVILRIAPDVLPIEALLAQRDEEGEQDDSPAKGKSASGRRADRTGVQLLSPAEEEWIEGGGRLVLALDADYGPLSMTPALKEPATRVFPIWPSLRELRSSSLRGISGLARGHAIFVAGHRPVLSRLSLGRGEVIVFGSPESFNNARLREGDGLQLLGLLTEGRHVYFDEVAHGTRSDAGLLELLQRWRLGPFVLLVALTLMFRFWRNGVRVGPAEMAPAESRREAVDLVESLGQLYERSLGRAEMIALYRSRFEQAVAARTHTRGEELNRRVRELAPWIARTVREDSSDMSRAQFAGELQEINEAFGRLDAKRG